jgi:hypothetical protein
MIKGHTDYNYLWLHLPFHPNICATCPIVCCLFKFKYFFSQLVENDYLRLAYNGLDPLDFLRWDPTPSLLSPCLLSYQSYKIIIYEQNFMIKIPLGHIQL